MTYEQPTVPCDTCGRPTPMDRTKRCDDCWEVEGRLRGYLNRGGANARTFAENLLWETAPTLRKRDNVTPMLTLTENEWRALTQRLVSKGSKLGERFVRHFQEPFEFTPGYLNLTFTIDEHAEIQAVLDELKLVSG